MTYPISDIQGTPPKQTSHFSLIQVLRSVPSLMNARAFKTYPWTGKAKDLMKNPSSFIAIVAFLIMIPVTTTVGAEVEAVTRLSSQSGQVGVPLVLQYQFANTAEPKEMPRSLMVDGMDIWLTGRSKIVNQQSVSTLNYVYSVVPKRPGKFKIPSFSVQLGEQQIRTEPAVLQVTENRSSTPRLEQTALLSDQSPPPQQPLAPERDPHPIEDSDTPLYYGEVVIKAKTAYLAEVVPIEFRFYFRADKTFDRLETPTFKDEKFMVAPLKHPTRSSQLINGISYNVISYQTEIIALESGKIEIPSAVMDGRFFPTPAMTALSGFDSGERIQVTTTTKQLNILESPQGQESFYKQLWSYAANNTRYSGHYSVIQLCKALVGKSLESHAVLEIDIGPSNLSQATSNILNNESPESLLVGGRMLMYGAPTVPINPTEALKKFEQCNNTTTGLHLQKEAIYEIGHAHIHGLGTLKNVETGLRWIRRSAEKGYEPAIKFLSDYEEQNVSTSTEETQQPHKSAENSHATPPNTELAKAGLDTAGNDSDLGQADDPEILAAPFVGWSDLSRYTELSELPPNRRNEMFKWWAVYSNHYISNQIKVSSTSNIPKLQVLLKSQNDWIASRLSSRDYMLRTQRSPADIYFGSAITAWAQLGIFLPFIYIIFTGFAVIGFTMYFQKHLGADIKQLTCYLIINNKWVLALIFFAICLDAYGLLIKYLGMWGTVPSLALVSYTFGLALLIRYVLFRKTVSKTTAALLAVALYIGWFAIRLALTSEVYKPSILTYLCCYGFYRILRQSFDNPHHFSTKQVGES